MAALVVAIVIVLGLPATAIINGVSTSESYICSPKSIFERFFQAAFKINQGRGNLFSGHTENTQIKEPKWLLRVIRIMVIVCVDDQHVVYG